MNSAFPKYLFCFLFNANVLSTAHSSGLNARRKKIDLISDKNLKVFIVLWPKNQTTFPTTYKYSTSHQHRDVSFTFCE